MDCFPETKRWHKDEEEIPWYTDSTHRDKTVNVPCSVHSFLIYSSPFFSVPLTEPLDFAVFGESSTSVNLSWKAIPIGKLRGFLSHYKLCSLQLHSEQTDEGVVFHFHHAYVAKKHISPLSVLTCYSIYNWNHIYVVVLAFLRLFFFFQCVTTCLLLRRNTAWWTWRQGRSTTSAWLQWREKERVPRLSALSTLCQRTWRVNPQPCLNHLDKHTGLERRFSPHFSPPSAAVDPGCAVSGVFDLNIVHLHAEAVSDIWWSPPRTFILHFSSFSPDHVSRIKRKLFPPVPTPVISDFTPSQVREMENLILKLESN